MTEEIPQWAKERAAELITADPTSISHYDVHYVEHSNTCLAFARYIAEHGEPPVDPLLVEARRVAMGTGNWSPDYAEQMVEGELDDSPVVRAALAALRRGIELAKNGEATNVYPDLLTGLREAREALEWYDEQSRLARLIHSEGDVGRIALAADGGNRARATLAHLDTLLSQEGGA